MNWKHVRGMVTCTLKAPGKERSSCYKFRRVFLNTRINLEKVLESFYLMSTKFSKGQNRANVPMDASLLVKKALFWLTLCAHGLIFGHLVRRLSFFLPFTIQLLQVALTVCNLFAIIVIFQAYLPAPLRASKLHLPRYEVQLATTPVPKW